MTEARGCCVGQFRHGCLAYFFKNVVNLNESRNGYCIARSTREYLVESDVRGAVSNGKTVSQLTIDNGHTRLF